MKWIVNILLLFLISGRLIAQGLCDNVNFEPGNFDVDNINFRTVCSVPFLLKLQDNSGGSEVKYAFEYDGQTNLNNINFQTLPEYNYTKGGNYTILQYGKKSGKEMVACIKFEIIEPKAPKIDYEVCNNELSLNFQNDAQNHFEDIVFFWNGQTELISNAQLGVVNVTKNNLNFANNVNVSLYAYKKRTDKFGNIAYAPGCSYISSFVIDPNKPKEKPQITYLETLDNDKVKLQYISAFPTKTHKVFDSNLITLGTTNTDNITITGRNNAIEECFKISYLSCGTEIISDNICTKNLKINESLQTNTFSFNSTNPANILNIDKGTIIGLVNSGYVENDNCLTNSCYQLELVNGSTTIKSKPECTNTHILINKLSEDIYLTNTNDQIFLEYQSFSQSEKVLLKNIYTNVIEKELISIASNKVSNTSDKYCTLISTINSCKTESLNSDVICNITLKFDGKGKIAWSSENPFLQKIKEYEIVIKDINGGLKKKETLSNIIYEKDLNPNESEVLVYEILAVSDKGLISRSNKVKVLPVIGIYIPTVFTPNGDGQNDILEIKSNGVQKYEYLICNRWGKTIYEGDQNSPSWDGHLGLNGIYTIKINYTTTTGLQYKESYSFNLIR